MFSGWIYDTIYKHNQEIYVGNTMLLRYIAHAKRKNDHVDAEKLANLLRCNLFPKVYMVPGKTRMMRGMMRYRNFVQREITRYKNHSSTQLMSYGIVYENRSLHGKRYFATLLTEAEIDQEMLITLQCNRLTIDLLRKVERGLKRRLLSNKELRERVQRLRREESSGSTVKGT